MSGMLAGLNIAITGAAGGIGASIAREAAAQGAFLNLIDASDDVGSVRDDIRSRGGRAISTRADIRDRDQFRSALQTGVDEAGGLDVLFNNAGISRQLSLLDTDEEQYRLLFDVNVWGVIVGIQEAAGIFVAQGRGGKIINTTSTGGRQGRDEFAAYCATKAAVISLTQSAARGLARHNITVNGFAPGVVGTQLWDSVAGSGPSRDERLAGYLPRIPLERVAQPEDIVPTALFLASSGSDYMTGQVVMIDGGMVMV